MTAGLRATDHGVRLYQKDVYSFVASLWTGQSSLTLSLCRGLAFQTIWEFGDLSLIIFASKILQTTISVELKLLFYFYVILVTFQFCLANKNFLQAMQTRISEMQNQEVDYLRFDRIKIQRKRMQHILEVIKDLSFKNKELFKENAALKEERLHQGHYEKLYIEMTGQRAILIQKNMQISAELEKYRSTVIHQEILINSLKQELYGENTSVYRSYLCQAKQFGKDDKEMGLVVEEYKILQEQYDQLKKEYSKLYKATRKGQAEKSSEKHRHVGKENDSEVYESKQIHIKKKNSSSKIAYYQQADVSQNNQAENWSKLKQKYDKCKKMRKELSTEVKALRQALLDYDQREQRHVQLIQLLKQKRTKICECHVNKLKKRMQQSAGNNVLASH